MGTGRGGPETARTGQNQFSGFRFRLNFRFDAGGGKASARLRKDAVRGAGCGGGADHRGTPAGTGCLRGRRGKPPTLHIKKDANRATLNPLGSVQGASHPDAPILCVCVPLGFREGAMQDFSFPPQYRVASGFRAQAHPIAHQGGICFHHDHFVLLLRRHRRNTFLPRARRRRTRHQPARLRLLGHGRRRLGLFVGPAG